MAYFSLIAVVSSGAQFRPPMADVQRQRGGGAGDLRQILQLAGRDEHACLVPFRLRMLTRKRVPPPPHTGRVASRELLRRRRADLKS
jgi:hypothetical protein